MRSVLLILSALLFSAEGNIISVSDLKLQPLSFLYKYRFVFSDLKDDNDHGFIPLESAHVRVDLRMQYNNNASAANTTGIDEQRLFLFMGERSILSVAVADLERSRVEGKLTNGKEIENVLLNYVS
jgi:hypothetical protein